MKVWFPSQLLITDDKALVTDLTEQLRSLKINLYDVREIFQSGVNMERERMIKWVDDELNSELVKEVSFEKKFIPASVRMGVRKMMWMGD